MEITKEALIVGETILVRKDNINSKRMYFGNAGLVHFISNENNYKNASGLNFTIEELQVIYTIEEPQSKVVPLELKVYDLVPVKFKDRGNGKWTDGNLILVIPNNTCKYYILRKDGISVAAYKYCEFI